MTPEEERLKALTSEARAAIKDLKQAIREAHRIKVDTLQRVDQLIAEQVEVGLKGYVAEIKKAQARAVAEVDKKFSRLANIFLTGKESGKGDPLDEIVARGRMKRNIEKIDELAAEFEGGD